MTPGSYQHAVRWPLPERVGDQRKSDAPRKKSQALSIRGCPV
jgi:hypothetical protein